MRFAPFASVLLTSLLLAPMLASRALAQSFTPVREQKNLTPEALSKLQQIEQLNALPPGDWRFHAGDLPHGESPALDDSSWQAIPAPAARKSVPSSREAVWYRRTIEVPRTLNGYDLTGARIWFQFQADANGPMPEIIYFNGRRVALGDDLEPIVLFEPAHPGDKLLVAVKLLATVDIKRWTGVSLRIEPLDSTRPPPEDIRMQCLTAANLLPALPEPRPDLLPTVEKAVAAIDTNALQSGNQRAFDASLRKAQSILSTLRPALGTATIDLAGNSHIDAAWLWPRSETIDVVRRTFTTALQLMNEYPDYTFTQSAAQYSAWMADKYPGLNQQIAARVKEGRWEIVGGMWVEPDLNLPGGESLVRQLLVGQRMFHSLYGVTARIGWNPDSFGYNWQLPQIYKRSGMDYFVTQKMHWNDTNQLPFRLFWWQSPDGSKVLTYFPTDYAWTNVNPTRLSADFSESAARNPGTAEHLDLFGVGDHGGGPTRAMLDQATHWVDLSHQTGTDAVAMPNLRFSTAQQFFDRVQPTLSATSPVWNYDRIAQGWTAPQPDAPFHVGIPTWNDELYFEYHRGVYTSQAHHKQNMRRSEEATLDAEKLASFAWLQGAQYPAEELTENWKKIAFNQFHDLAAGSGIAVIYRDAQKDYTEVFNSDALISDAAQQRTSRYVNTRSTHQQDAHPLVVTNSLPWPRNEVAQFRVQTEQPAESLQLFRWDGQPVPFEIMHKDRDTHSFDVAARVEVPALGYATVQAIGVNVNAPGIRTMDSGTPRMPAGKFTFFNSLVRFELDPKTGCITQLSTGTDPSKQYLAAGACGNQLQAFADVPRNYDAWNIDPGTLDKAPTLISQLDRVEVVRDDSLRKTIRIERTFNKSHITQDISLDDGADIIVIDTTVDWHEKHTLLKAAFPLAVTSAKATYEIPFGSIQRPTTRDNTFSKAQFEVPALRWANLGGTVSGHEQGVSILNDSKYGYDALGNTLRLTLLRAPTWPDPDADQGIQHFRYAIYPHTGPWQKAETIHRAYELNQPLTAMQTFAHTGSLPPTHSFVSVDEPNVILTAVKKGEDADALIFRMYEATGTATTVHLHVPDGATAAIETNLMEKPEGAALPLNKNTVEVAIKPYEILTVQVAYPHGGSSMASASR